MLLSGIGVSLLLGALSIAGLLIVVGYVLWRRKQLDERLDAFIETSEFRVVRDDAEFERVADKLAVLCGVGAKIQRAAVRNVGSFEVVLVAYRFPQYRVDADGSWDESLQESERCVALVVSGFAAALPAFRLLPNNWAVRVLRGHEANRLGDIEPFGAFNYVLATEPSRVRALLGGELQVLLGRNRWLAIDGREGFLAFFGTGHAEQPADLPRFFQLSLEVAHKVSQNAA